MARVAAFQPYRYTSAAGELSKLVTQPYDKISPEMQARYLAASPYNLVRVILGPAFPDDNAGNNVYTRAAGYFHDWIRTGILARDAERAIYPYFQTFSDPETGGEFTRKGFIGLGGLEPYEAGVVHRHELTLSGPKRDRRQLLDATQAHFGQIFMLYADRERAVDALLDEAAAGPPIATATDEYGVVHRVWRITDGAKLRHVQELMAPRQLVIADGHHRYETALAYRNEGGPDHVMMTFVNTHSPGLRILATHRVLRRMEGFDSAAMLDAFAKIGRVERVADDAGVKAGLAGLTGDALAVGVVGPGVSALVHAPNGTAGFDVDFLHGKMLPALGIMPEAVRDKHVFDYVRGIDKAIAEVREMGAAAGFLLRATPVERVMAHSLAGGVMPQKSTDFYPKLLSGLTIWKIDE